MPHSDQKSDAQNGHSSVNTQNGQKVENGRNGQNDRTVATETGHSEARYLDFKCLPEGSLNEDGELALNRYSACMTRGHDFPGAQVRFRTCHLQSMTFANASRPCCTPRVFLIDMP